MCVLVNEDLRSVTVSTPQPLQEMKRIKSEVYEGFSHVFSTESSQVNITQKPFPLLFFSVIVAKVMLYFPFFFFLD